jgi:hypothetical protein
MIRPIWVVLAPCVLAPPLAFAAVVPTPVGVGPRFHPTATSASVETMRPVGRFRCSASIPQKTRAHIELFAQRRVVIVPAGIGVAPPLVRSGATVLRGQCTYPLRTLAPTGVVEFDRQPRLTLGDLFAVWGRRLSAERLLSFRGRVRAYVAGKRWREDVRAIRLTRHAEIVLEVGPYVRPHTSFLFGPGR